MDTKNQMVTDNMEQDIPQSGRNERKDNANRPHAAERFANPEAAIEGRKTFAIK